MTQHATRHVHRTNPQNLLFAMDVRLPCRRWSMACDCLRMDSFLSQHAGVACSTACFVKVCTCGFTLRAFGWSLPCTSCRSVHTVVPCNFVSRPRSGGRVPTVGDDHSYVHRWKPRRARLNRVGVSRPSDQGRGPDKPGSGHPPKIPLFLCGPCTKRIDCWEEGTVPSGDECQGPLKTRRARMGTLLGGSRPTT